MTDDIERAAEVLVNHPVIPDYKSVVGTYYCPKCRVEINGFCNSPDHARHQAQALADAGIIPRGDAEVTVEYGVRYRDEDGIHELWVPDEGLARHLADVTEQYDVTSPPVEAVIKRTVTTFRGPSEVADDA